MSLLGNVDWEEILRAHCQAFEDKVEGVDIEIDCDIIADTKELATKTLADYRLDNPNAAKVAGHICYWLCRLKPVRNAEGASKRPLMVNEAVALQVGLSICHRYFDDLRAEAFSLDDEILKDWVISLRYDIDSPNALAVAFELMSGRRVH